MGSRAMSTRWDAPMAGIRRNRRSLRNGKRTCRDRDDIAAVVAVGVVDVTRPPVVGRGVDDWMSPCVHSSQIPISITWLKPIEPTRPADPRGTTIPWRAPMARSVLLCEVVEMGVGDQDEVERAANGRAGCPAICFASRYRATAPNSGRPAHCAPETAAGKWRADPGHAPPCPAPAGEIRPVDRPGAGFENAGDDMVPEKLVVPLRPSFLGQDAGVLFFFGWPLVCDIRIGVITSFPRH